jgi:drug/metabolite transporter (DMT)-like permease
MNHEKIKGHILIFAANILFAVNIPISKSLIPSHVTPEALTLLRIVFGCVMFWTISLFVAKEKVALKDLGLLLLCAVCGVAFNQTLFMVGLNLTSPVDASIIATAGPIYVMLLAAFILKEPITGQKATGVLLGVAGAVTLILSSSQGESQAGGLAGNLRIVCSNLLYSIYVVLSRSLSLRYSAITIMKWMFLFSTIILIPFTYRAALETPAFHRDALIWQEAGAIAYVLLLGTVLPYLLIPMSLKRLRPTTVSMYNYIQPIVASVLAVFLGQSGFGWEELFSAALVFAGVYLVTQTADRTRGGWPAQSAGGSMIRRKGNASPVDAHVSSVDAHASSVDAHVSSVDVHASSVDAHASSVDAHASPVDVYGSPVDVYGSSVDVYGSSVDVYGSSVDVYGSSVDVYGSSVDVYGPPVDVYGPPVDVYGPPVKATYPLS